MSRERERERVGTFIERDHHQPERHERIQHLRTVMVSDVHIERSFHRAVESQTSACLTFRSCSRRRNTPGTNVGCPKGSLSNLVAI